MRLASIKSGESFDGQCVLVDSTNQWMTEITEPYSSLLHCVENWQKAFPLLLEKSQWLEDKVQSNDISSLSAFNEAKTLACFPRTWSFLDGSAYIQHIILVRKARNAELPETLHTVPLMYQGINDRFLAPREDIPFQDQSFGLDFEGEIGVITDFVPMGTKASEASKHILLFVLINDVSLRGLIPAELAQGFGFLQSKPASALSPLAITPDELGDAYKDGRLFLPLSSKLNGQQFGTPDAGEMHFSFFDLIEHAAKTRNLMPGTLIGSGTVSNKDETRGGSCLAEKRMLEKINNGEMSTPFMGPGDEITLEIIDKHGKNLFGSIHQRVV